MTQVFPIVSGFDNVQQFLLLDDRTSVYPLLFLAAENTFNIAYYLWMWA